MYNFASERGRKRLKEIKSERQMEKEGRREENCLGYTGVSHMGTERKVMLQAFLKSGFGVMVY